MENELRNINQAREKAVFFFGGGELARAGRAAMRLQQANCVVVVVDVQGRLAELMQGREELFEEVRRLAAGARCLGLPLLVTEQNPAKLGATRTELADAVAGAPVFAKMTFSCAGEPAFMAALAASGRGQVLLCGIEAHVCMWQTAAELLALGYQVYVAADAVSSRTVLNRELGLARMRDAGAVLVSTEMALMELMRTAEHPRFREVLKLIR